MMASTPKKSARIRKSNGISVGSLEDLLQQTLSPQRIERARKRADAILERMTLDELRKDRKMTQGRLAAAMKVQQSEISRIEKRSEVRIGTLRSYVGALGGHIEVRAVFPDKNVELRMVGK